MKKKLNIGFDIGVTSVGWSLIDEDYNIVDMGVRLFNDPANPKDGSLKNGKRRASRTNRRRIKRIRTRKDAFANFLLDNNWINSIDELAELINVDITEFNVENPIELKVKALNEKIPKEQLIFILFHYIHHRGFFYVTKDMLDANIDISQEEIYPSVELFNFFKENGYYKGNQNQKYSARQYIKEIERIMEVQGIDSNFTKGFIRIFSQVRDFATGPGSQKSPTPYGLYFINKEGQLECKGKNLWDATIGKCTYYPDEFRGLKNSPIAELFNFMNDLNNIYLFNDRKFHLSKEVKTYLFNSINKQMKTKNTQKKVSLKVLVNCIKETSKEESIQQINECDIFGYRIDSDKKFEFTELNNYSIIVKWLIQNQLVNKNEVDLFNIDFLDKVNDVFVLISKEQDATKQLILLNQNYPSTNEESNLDLLKKIKGLTKTHSLSYKAMLNFIKYCIDNKNEYCNQMSYFQLIKKTNVNNDSKPSKYIKTGLYDNEIISPTARRAFNQNVKIMNKIIKFYSNEYEIENITFELARDKNSKEEKDSIEKRQKENKKEIIEICNEYKIDADKLNSIARLRLKLWKDQGGFDIYDGEPILIQDVLSGNGLQIDHIIPYSICAIDSRSNKVLTKISNNKDKGNLTPYLWLEKEGKFKDFKDRVDKYIADQRKKNNLLYKLDPLMNMEGFIERNIVDTRYASRVVLNTFQDFFKQNKELYPNVKIKVINGSITNFARYNLLTGDSNKVILHKNRDLYCHHAIDAAIVCYLGMNTTISNLTKWFNDISRTSDSLTRDQGSNRLCNKITGEIIDITKWVDKSYEVKKFAEQLATYNDIYDSKLNKIISNNKVKFSRQIVKKNNIQLSNETIYSFKWKKDSKGKILDKGNIITKIDLFDKVENLDKYFKQDKINQKELEKLFVYQWDKQMYEKIMIIYNQYYSGNKNPFIEYMNDEYKIKNPTFIKIDKQNIRKLRILGVEKEDNNIIVLNKHNNNAIMESLNSLSVRIYKDKKNKYKLVGLNQKVLGYDSKKRCLKLDQTKLDKVLSRLNIENKKYIELNVGSIFINKETNKLFYMVGGSYNENKIEIKSLFADNILSGFPKGRIIMAISSIIETYDIVQVDELGNIYNRRKIEL